MLGSRPPSVHSLNSARPTPANQSAVGSTGGSRVKVVHIQLQPARSPELDVAEAVARPLDSTTAPRHLSPTDQFALSFYWFATNFHWGAILVVLLPSQVLRMVGGENKGTGAGVVCAMNGESSID